MADIAMNDVAVLQVELQKDTLRELKYISENFGTDLNTDLVHLLECYVEQFRGMRSNPVGKILLGGK